MGLRSTALHCISIQWNTISEQCRCAVSVYLGHTLDRGMDDREEKLYWTVLIYAEAIKPEKGSNFKLNKSAIKIVALSSSPVHWTQDSRRGTLDIRQRTLDTEY